MINSVLKVVAPVMNSNIETRDWSRNRDMWVRILETRTGAGVEEWTRRIEKARLTDEAALRRWLEGRGVTGYAQSLLIMERFGYPDFVMASAGDLIDAQYADRIALRPIFDAVLDAAMQLGSVALQARKGYVSLVTPRRTFARVQATTRARVDLGLRLDLRKPAGPLRPCTIHETMRWRIGLTALEDFDDDARAWLRRAYEENG